MEEMLGKLKEQANKAKDFAKKFGKTTVDKTNTVVSQTKLKFAIGKTEDKIKEVYAQIGSDIYESYAGGATEYPDVQSLCERLDELHKEVDNLREQLSELTETVKCEKCGAYNSADNAYCSSCGEKIETPEPAAEEDVVVTITPEEPSGEDE